MPDTEPGTAEAGGGAEPSGEREVDPRLLELLVCPLTKAPLRYDREARELISDRAGLAFPIRDGVPVMLAEEARPLDGGPPARGGGGRA